MKKLAMLFLAIAVFFLSPCLPAFAGGDDPTINEAKKLWEWNKKYEAVDCLEAVISDNFQNKKAYRLLIQYSLELNLWDKAVKAIEPPPIQKKYGKEVAVWFANEAKEILDKGNQEKAENFYTLAFKLNPALRAPTVAQLFVEGKSNPKKYFPLVISLEPRQRTACADYLMDLSNKSKDETTKMGHMKVAAETDPNRYGDKYRVNANALGRRYLALAMENARWVGKETQTEKFRELAVKYLGNEIVDKKLPNTLICLPPYKQKFIMAKGERIKYWIQTPEGKKITYKISSNHGMIKVIYKNGKTIDMSKGQHLPKEIDSAFYVSMLLDGWVKIRINEKNM